MKFDDVVGKETASAALRKWYLFVLVEVIAIALAFFTLAHLERKYAVTATVIGTRYTSDITPGNGPAGLLPSSLLGATANNLPPITDFRLYMQFLTSPELASTLLNDDLLHRLFADEWHDGAWGPPDNFLQHVKNLIYGFAGLPPWLPPDSFSVARYLTRVLQIVPAKDTQMLTLTYEGKDPVLGKQLVMTVHHRADELVKQMARRRLDDKVGFLQKEIDRTAQQQELGVLVTTLAKAQIDRLYSQSQLPFAAEFADQPAASPSPVSPNVPLVLGAFIIAGAFIFFGYIVVSVRRALARMQRTRARRPPLEPEMSRAGGTRET